MKHPILLAVGGSSGSLESASTVKNIDTRLDFPCGKAWTPAPETSPDDLTHFSRLAVRWDLSLWRRGHFLELDHKKPGMAYHRGHRLDEVATVSRQEDFLFSFDIGDLFDRKAPCLLDDHKN